MTAPAEDRTRRRQWTEQAVQLAIQNKWDEACSLNQQLTALFPRDTEAWNRLGKAQAELGRYEEARQAYRKTLELDPVNQIARKNLQRLESLTPTEAAPSAAPKLEPHLFIEETGKTGHAVLLHPNPEALKAMTPGEKVELRPVGRTLSVYNVRDDHIGDIEPKLGLRLVR